MDASAAQPSGLTPRDPVAILREQIVMYGWSTLLIDEIAAEIERLRAKPSVARGHRDDELNDPRVLSDRRLLDIVGECVRKWDAFPTIPGSRRWFRNGGVALAEIERRLIERG